MESEIGKGYGRLVVIEKLDKRYFTTTIYKCRCDCGNYIDISVNKLHMVIPRAVDALRMQSSMTLQGRGSEDLWLRNSPIEKNKTYWKCKCDCGKECFVCSPNLLGRFTISCGCRNVENKKALATHVRQRACGRNDAVSL